MREGWIHLQYQGMEGLSNGEIPPYLDIEHDKILKVILHQIVILEWDYLEEVIFPLNEELGSSSKTRQGIISP